ncbi:hypothetical protein [Clostridium sp. SM-530-WT-3G]|uniref:hypothetical protein n=1 Tax=Clostridium sp. SM-530-WT-3G TaxID=2725303 RepID=UPI00145F796C|nr:hypothetical protein [Clostridium sp. SM-530-WT-3G]NME83771.1 hypothetical protein [Clostridium sp. SM-530-WT-3G]
MYEMITQGEADRIKYILNEAGLKDKINIEVLNGKYKINAPNIGESQKSEHYYGMDEFYLMDSNNGYNVLEYKNKLYEVFICIGEWAYETELKNAHITAGSSKFHDYSFQLELSQAFKDKENLYIVKNITNLAGKGALVRLYRGLGKDKAKKENRRERFIQEFNSEILPYKGKEWIVISKISLNDLFDDNKSEDILYNLLNSIFKAMLLVEGIGEEDI